MFTGEEAYAAGFVAELVEADQLHARVVEVADTIAGHAPLTMWSVKEAVRRLRLANIPDRDGIVRAVFGSEDFRHGLANFVGKQKPQWTGR